MVDKNYPIVSGMAKGIDSYSHTAAIKHNGFTIAVLGFGVDQCYPIEHLNLKETIAEKGLLISEYPPGTPPSKFLFPKRNRIIAGLMCDVLERVESKGREEGEMKRAKETAHNLYNMGMSDEFIAKAVNVSIELVRKRLGLVSL